jgi:hypothetical protein
LKPPLFLLIYTIEDNEIIEKFFSEGCTDSDGKPLALRNCDKISSLYNAELAEKCCCGKMHEYIYKKYETRLYQFLQIERGFSPESD